MVSIGWQGETSNTIQRFVGSPPSKISLQKYNNPLLFIKNTKLKSNRKESFLFLISIFNVGPPCDKNPLP